MLNNDVLDASGFQYSKNRFFIQFFNVSSYIIARYEALVNDNIVLKNHFEDYIKSVFVKKIRILKSNMEFQMYYLK